MPLSKIPLAGVSFSAIPAGTVIMTAGSTAPAGFIKANGAAISRTVYADLFAAIGTTFGTGNGSTTFNVPDMRGEFPRGWDDGRGIDSGRAFGSSQTDAMQGHYHNSIGYNSSGNVPFGTLAGQSSMGLWSPGNNGTTHVLSGPPQSNGTNGTPRTDSETRSRNVALLACIKF
jgi:phage-related tail fiber protein